MHWGGKKKKNSGQCLFLWQVKQTQLPGFKKKKEEKIMYFWPEADANFPQSPAKSTPC